MMKSYFLLIFSTASDTLSVPLIGLSVVFNTLPLNSLTCETISSLGVATIKSSRFLQLIDDS